MAKVGFRRIALAVHHASRAVRFNDAGSEEVGMTTIAAPHLPRHLIDRRRGNMEFNWGLTFVAALYLAVALVELSISVLAAPTITETVSFYVTVP